MGRAAGMTGRVSFLQADSAVPFSASLHSAASAHRFPLREVSRRGHR